VIGVIGVGSVVSHAASSNTHRSIQE